jgi:hypothetical protein
MFQKWACGVALGKAPAQPVQGPEFNPCAAKTTTTKKP